MTRTTLLALALTLVLAPSAMGASVTKFTPQNDADSHGGWTFAVPVPGYPSHHSLDPLADYFYMGPQRGATDYTYSRMRDGSGGSYWVSAASLSGTITSTLISATVRRFRMSNGCTMTGRRVWINVRYSANKQKAIQWDRFGWACDWFVTTFPRG